MGFGVILVFWGYKAQQEEISGTGGKRLDLEKLHTRHMASREGLGFI
jgi:hypothetical protein